MLLEDIWEDRVDGCDHILSDDINLIAKAVIELEKKQKVDTFVTPETFGAKGDGVTDDTKSFQDAIDSGCPLIVVPKKTYVVNGLMLRSNIYIFGTGTLKMCGISVGANSHCLYGDGINNVKIEGLTIETYNRPTYLSTVLNAKNVVFCNIRIDGKGWNDDLTANESGLVNGILFETSKNIIVDRVYLKGVLQGKGIEFVGCEHSEIDSCTTKYIGRGGIYITDQNNNCRVSNNVVEYTKLNFNVEDGAIDLYATNHNITVEGNYINYFGDAVYMGCGIRLKSGTNNKAINNVIKITNDYCYAGILIQPRDEEISVASAIGNKIQAENGKTQYYIRIVEINNHPISDVIVSENVLSSDGTEFTATEALSIRSRMKNVLIEKNKFFIGSEFVGDKQGIYIHAEAKDADSTRENFIIAHNILYRGDIRVQNMSSGVIDGNIITSHNQSSRPVIITDCNDMFIKNNILKSSRTDITDGVLEKGICTNIIKENILVAPFI